MNTEAIGAEGLQAVHSRIGQLQLLLSGGTAAARATPLGSAWSASAAPAGDGSDFSASLAQLLGTAGGSGATGAAQGASQTLGTAAVALARSYTGVPYRWGGTNPATGLDCSGLVQLVYRKLGVDLPRTSQQQQHCGTEVGSLAEARPGDLVFFGEPAHHVGIYVGDGKMIDAPRTGSTVGVHRISGYGRVSHLRRLSAPLSGQGLSGTAASGTAAVSGAPSGTASRLDGPYAELFVAAGTRYGVDPALLSAVAKAESGYNPRAVSAAGAQGLMQLMPGTARSLGVDPLRPDQAVAGAARLLSSHLRTYSGRVDLALAAYNAGPGAVNRYGGVPPYAETRSYVQRVTSYWKALR